MKKSQHTSSFVIDKVILSIIGVSILLIVGAVLIIMKTSQSEIKPDTNAKAVVAQNTHDWGEIQINGGNVEKKFFIKNEGTRTLKLYNVKTSCMCTTAKLEQDGQTSPVFGMHGKSTYVMKVPPEKSAILKVIFDPAFHGPSGIGTINRVVNVSTNDPSNPKLAFILTANVVN